MSYNDNELRIINAIYMKIKKENDVKINDIYTRIENLEDAIIRVADTVREDRKNKKEQMQLAPVNQQQMVATLQTHDRALNIIKAQLSELSKNGEELLYDYHQNTVNHGGSNKKMQRGDVFFNDN